MRKTTLLCLVFLVTLPAFGQVSPKLKRGSAALLFSFGGFSNLAAGNFNGGIGAKYYMAPNMALRGGIQFTSASSEIPANAPAGTQGTDGEQSATVVGVNGAVEMHFGKARVSPYIGAGLGFGTASTESKDAVIAPATQTTTKNSFGGETIGGTPFFGGTTLTVVAIVGTEFFLFDEVSLAAEYQAGFTSTSPKDEEVVTGTTTTTTKGVSNSGLSVSSAGFLTLGVYF